jgi:hypothetical protein
MYILNYLFKLLFRYKNAHLSRQTALLKPQISSKILLQNYVHLFFHHSLEAIDGLNFDPQDPKIQNMEIKFDVNGNIRPVNSAGNKVKLNEKQKDGVYKELGIGHAAVNHSAKKSDYALALRTTGKNANAQSSKYKNDAIFIACCEMAKKKCLDGDGVFDVDALLKAGIVKSSQDKYEFILPLPKDYGTVYVNLKHAKINQMPSWVKQGEKAFSNDRKLQDVVEIPMTELLVVFNEKGAIVTSYGRGFPTLR